MADNLNAYLRFIANTGPAVAEIGKLNAAVSGLGGKLQGLARLGAGLGLGALGIHFDESAVRDAMTTEGIVAHLATAMGKDADKINEVRKRANEIASGSVIGNKAELLGIYDLIGAGESYTDAMKVAGITTEYVTATMKDSQDAMEQYEPSTRLVADTINIFGDKLHSVAQQAQHDADVFTALQTRYEFKSQGEVTEALKYISPSAHAAGISLNEAAAAAALLSENGLHAAEAGTAVREVLDKLTVGKQLQGFRVLNASGGLDLAATVDRLKGVLPPPGVMRDRMLQSFGFNERDMAGVTMLIDHATRLRYITDDLAKSTGDAARLSQVRMAAADAQWATFINRLGLFKEALGESVLGPLNKLLSVLSPVAKLMFQFSEAHTGISELAMGFMALASAAVVFGGAWQILGIGKTLEFLRVGAVLTKAWTVAQWALDAALAANPIVLTIAAAIALGVVAYEIVKHWSAVAGFFRALPGEVAGVFRSIINAITGDVALMYKLGHDFVTTLASGMISAAMAPVRAAEAIAHRIARFFVGHSPIPEGALADLDVGGEIARSMRPGPIINAVRQMAAAAALAIPLSVTPAMGAVAPAMGVAHAPGTTLAMHGPHERLAASAPVITNHVRVVVNGEGKPADIKKAVEAALDESTNKIATALKRHQFDHDRRSF